MELTHIARVPVTLDRAWEVVGDPAALAAALPGAELEEIDGLVCRGTLTVRIGPITARYGGTVSLTWRDDQAHRTVLEVVGDEIEGVGRVEATINATLTAESPVVTRVVIVSNLTMTGRAGQFGQALLADVGQGLLADLVTTLQETTLADDIATTAWLDMFPQHQDDIADPPLPHVGPVVDEEGALHLDWQWTEEDEAAVVDEATAAPKRERRRDRRRRKREALRELAAADAVDAAPEPEPEPEPVAEPDPEPEPVVEPEAEPEPEPEPEPVVEVAEEPAGEEEVVEVATAEVVEAEPEPVVPGPEPEPEPVVPEPTPEPIIPTPEPEPIVPEPTPEPIVPEPTPEPIVPSPEPERRPEPEIVPPTPDEPEVLPTPDRPRATPEPALAPVDVISPQALAAEPSLGERVAPYVLVLALLWLLRRLFGSSDD